MRYKSISVIKNTNSKRNVSTRKSTKSKIDTVLFQKIVWNYYRTQGRHELPWRKTHDAYQILVSEVMLQQTQVERVIPYFSRFLRRFPTIQDLAEASLGTVLKQWQGLGYNRRAKLLWLCARDVVTEYDGVLPRERANLEGLTGIGPYTAGAVRAFAYNEPEVFIETNIRSALLFHFFPRGRNIADTRLIPLLHALVEGVNSPRKWYSALMDYGTYIKRTHPNPSRKSKHHVKQKPFAGSLREMRGAILRTLIQKKSLEDLRIRGGERFMTALIDLQKEGMVGCRKGTWTLAK